MRDFVTRMFKRASDEVDGEPRPLPSYPAEGQVYSFRTRPLSEFAPPATGRYAAFKVLGVTETDVAVAVLDGIWPAAPSLKETRTASIITEHRFAQSGR